jgi:hypothetical protein
VIGAPHPAAMRFIACIALTLSAVHGQSDVSKLLSQGLGGALAAFEPVAEADKNAILTATAQVLAKHVTFRPDGTAAAVCTKLGEQHVEWKNLVVRNITKQAVTEADKLNGISRRFLVSFGCDAHRSLDAKTSRWSEWKGFNYILFPAAIEFEWKSGAWTLKSQILNGFSPGPGPSIADPKPAAKDAGLPPGMTRGR